MFSLEKRKLRGDTMVSFQILKGACKKDGKKPFTRACSDRTEGEWLLSKRE